jgi:hypothetical protein
MECRIIGFHPDADRHGMAELECGHFQPTRHNPPGVSRPGGITPAGRVSCIGYQLQCKQGDVGALQSP